MKIIDLVEYLRETLKQSNYADGAIINQYTGITCTSTPEEAKQIVMYLIEGLFFKVNESQRMFSDTHDIVSEIVFSRYKDGRISSGHLYGGVSSGFWLPPLIDEESHKNIIEAINDTGVFQIEEFDNALFGVVEERFHTTYDKLKSYMENSYTYSDAPKIA